MILAINTSSFQYAVALTDLSGETAAEFQLTETRGHYGAILPALDFLLETARFPLDAIKAVAVAVGPGSFTGLRVGISAAKGFCHALGIPIIGVSSLEALAFPVSAAGSPVVSLLHSRRDEVFWASFGQPASDKPFQRLSPDRASRIPDLPALLSPPLVFVGNSYGRQAPLLRREINDTDFELAPICLWHPAAGPVGALAAARLKAQALDDPMELSPVYLRPPDIRPPSPSPPSRGCKGG